MLKLKSASKKQKKERMTKPVKRKSISTIPEKNTDRKFNKKMKKLTVQQEKVIKENMKKIQESESLSHDADNDDEWNYEELE